MTTEFTDYMYGKKYVALGDSFTEGDFSTFVDENGLEKKGQSIAFR